MRIDHDLAEPGGAPAGPPVAVSIGNFDGVHTGHRAILATARRAIESRGGGEVAVITFDPNPRCVLTPERCPATLTPMPARARLLRAAGVDRLTILRFDRAMSRWSAAHFVDRAVASMPLRTLVVGPDFALGHDREGSIAVLRELGRARGFDLDVVAPRLDGGEPVSSSRIRAALAAGDVGEAARLLGRLHAVEGEIVPGDEAAGAENGAAPVRVAGRLALPAEGSYGCWSRDAQGWRIAAAAIRRVPGAGDTPGLELRVAGQAQPTAPAPVTIAFARRLAGDALRSVGGPRAALAEAQRALSGTLPPS